MKMGRFQSKWASMSSNISWLLSIALLVNEK